jgi:hypothetical protein
LTTSDVRQGHLLFDFRELDSSVEIRLQKALAELPETHASGMEGRDVFDSVVLDRRNCLAKVLAAIGKDYAANKRKEPQAAWSFDCAVELIAGTTLNVMARLSDKTGRKKGSVF